MTFSITVRSLSGASCAALKDAGDPARYPHTTQEALLLIAHEVDCLFDYDEEPQTVFPSMHRRDFQ